MPRLILCNLFLFLPFALVAQQGYQQYLELSYAEIDSLMYIQYDEGAYYEGIPLMQAGRAKAEKDFGQQDSAFANYTDNLGFYYGRTGQYDKALTLGTQAKNIYEKVLGTNHANFAICLNNLAFAYKRVGNYDQALSLSIQAKNIKEKVYGSVHPDFATALNNLANTYAEIGNYKEALPFNEQVVHIYRKVLGEQHPYFIVSLNNLACTHRDLGNYDKALLLFTQVKNSFKKVLGKEHPGFATALNNLATVHERIGDYDKAGSLYLEAKDIRQSALGKAHPDFAELLNSLAKVEQRMGYYDKAWDLLEQAMNSQSSLSLHHDFSAAWLDSLVKAPYPSNRHTEVLLNSLNIAYTLLEQDSRIQNAKAKQVLVAELATSLLSKARQQVSTEQDKLRMLAKSNAWLQKSLKVLSPEQHPKQAFELSDQNKSVLLYQATKSEVAYRLGNLPDSLIRKNKQLLKRKSQLQAKLLGKGSEEEKDRLRNELNRVYQALDEFEKLIAQDYPKYHRLKYPEIQPRVEAIQAALDKETALLEYVIGDSTVHIFYMDRQQLQWEKSFVSKDKLNTAIQALHQALSDYELIARDKEQAYRDYTQNAHWFYQKLLAPVLKDKQGIQKLVIITDGKLGHLPFETFLVEKAPAQFTNYRDLHYLLQDYSLSYDYSATLWKENKEARAAENNGQLLGIAANYGLQMDSYVKQVRSPIAKQLRKQLTPLPAARQEVEMLQATYQGFFAFDSLASERTVKAKARDFGVLHFAVHGLLDEKRPILSSLALTESNDSTEDNFWQAYEISKMELNADLVVLSACETGYGKFETGNGIASLARSFMYAGASSLVVSLWQVNDQATKEIMQRFYQNLAEGQTIDEALRQAKLEYIQLAQGLAAHPTFWSPFIQMGKTEPVEIKAKGGLSTWVFVGLGAVVLLVLGVFWWRQKQGV